MTVATLTRATLINVENLYEDYFGVIIFYSRIKYNEITNRASGAPALAHVAAPGTSAGSAPTTESAEQHQLQRQQTLLCPHKSEGQLAHKAFLALIPQRETWRRNMPCEESLELSGLENNASYFGYSSTCQSQRTECCCPPSALFSTDFSSFSLSTSITLFLPVTERTIFDEAPFSHLAHLSTALRCVLAI